MDEREITEATVTEFRKLRSALYQILPDDCPLKPRNVLSGSMVALFDMSMVEQKLVEKGDICSLCPNTSCPHNNVPDREARTVKIAFYHGALSEDTGSQIVS